MPLWDGLGLISSLEGRQDCGWVQSQGIVGTNTTSKKSAEMGKSGAESRDRGDWTSSIDSPFEK